MHKGPQRNLINYLIIFINFNLLISFFLITCQKNLGQSVNELSLMRLGKDKHALLLAVFLVFTASVSGQTETKYKFHLDGNLPANDVIITDQSVIINYSLTELNVLSLKNSAGSFYRISIPGHISSTKPGKPELPVFSRLISIPEGSDYTIKISAVKTLKITPSAKNIEGLLFPAQESETKNVRQTKQTFRFDKEAYAVRGFIPSDTVSIESLGIVRKVKLANLYISPVRYNPHSNVLEVITSMKIEIIFNNTSVPVTKSIAAERSLFNQTLDKGILNYNPGQVVPGYSDKPVKMIILTDTAFKKLLEPFIKWKMQKGFNLKVLYKGTKYAGNDYSIIKDTISRIYKSATTDDPPPEYLLIIGDVNRIPVYGTGSTGNITDMYYGEFDGNGDYMPEMFVGRLPVADTTELKTAVGKIIQYEKFQFADTNQFYSRSLVQAGFDEGSADYMNGLIKYATTYYLTPANRITEYHFNYPQSYTSKDSLIKLINKGVSFINYTGHGDALGWLHVNFKSPDVLTLTNKNMYPFVISNACRTAQYNIANTLGTRMVLTDSKGAIGFIGCSNDSYWDEDFYWAVGTGPISLEPTYSTSGLGAYDRMFHTHSESPADWYFTMGQINYAGNLAVSASNSPRKKYYWETYNLIGDPSIIPIMGKPQPIAVTLPDTLPNGIKLLTLNVDPFSYVAVSHFNTLWDASYASASGAVSLDMPGLTNDSCLVVITGQNKIPVIKTIHFANIHKEYINLGASSINDSLGNNNHLADFGESIFLKLRISNLGLSDAQNLRARISSSSQWITILKDSVSIGTLAARSEITFSDKLAITISDNVPDMAIATLDLVLNDNLSQKHYTVDICIHAPELVIVNCIMDDKVVGNGDFIPDPGESFRLIFKVQNRGSSDVDGKLAISNFQEGLSVGEPSVKSGVLKFGETTNIPILVKLSESVSSGSMITVTAALDCNPYLVNKDFSFRVGKIRESFEASSFMVFPWINVSPVPWVITSGLSYDGAVSAQSGAINHNGTTSLVLRTLYDSNDSVKFSYKVSCEPNYDFLSFKLNGAEVLKKSGEVPWTRKAFAVPEGLNTLEWSYIKDNSVSLGTDQAWIDMIDFAQSTTVKYIRKDLQVARIVIPPKRNHYGQEAISVKLLNPGKDTINGFNLAYVINDHFPPVKQFFNNKIIPNGDTVTVTFNNPADFSKYGFYKIVTYGLDNNDDYFLNDTLTANIENTRVTETVGIYPNPFTDWLSITVNSQIDEKLQITLTNLTGLKVYELEKEVQTGNNSFTLTNLRLKPALYYLHISSATINKTIPVLSVGGR